jgi:hypothetical protein
MKRRPALGAIALAAGIGLMSGATVAQAATYHPGKPAHRAAVAVRGIRLDAAQRRIPSCTNGDGCLIQETNGPRLWLGFAGNSDAPGTAVTQKSSSTNAQSLLWVGTTGSYGNLITSDHENYVAANSTCTGVTIKSSAASSGTVWFFDVGNNWNIENRYCDQQEGIPPNRLMEGDGTTGDQWGIGSGLGQYSNLQVTS